MVKKADKQTALTQQDLRIETQSIRQDLSSQISGVEKKLHMEIVGTQNDFLKFKDEIVHYLLKVQNKMDEVVKNMLTKADKQEIINRMDTFAQRSEDHDNKVLFHNHRINDLEVKTTDHESRLTRLESK